MCIRDRCVRIARAQPIPDADLPSWQAEIEWLFENEIDVHFTAEEDVLFPAARRLSELQLLLDELFAEHGWLRELFSQAKSRRMSAVEVRDFGQYLSALSLIHIWPGNFRSVRRSAGAVAFAGGIRHAAHCACLRYRRYYFAFYRRHCVWPLSRAQSGTASPGGSAAARVVEDAMFGELGKQAFNACLLYTSRCV